MSNTLLRQRMLPLLLSCLVPVSARAQLDQFHIVVDQTPASGTNALASYGFNPLTDTFFTSTFGAGGAVRAITGAGTSPVSSISVSEAQLQLYYRDGNPDRGVSNPSVSGLVLNPKPVGAFPAYSFAILTDLATTRFPSSTTVDPAVTKRVFRYNLQPVGSAGPTPPPYGDARDVMTTLVTLSNMGALQGSPSGTTSNAGRQGAFSVDGQSFYFLDTSTDYGGLYKTNVLTGATALVLDYAGLNTEPGVIAAPGGGDRILFRGSAANSNTGGLNYVDHNGATTSPQQSLISAAALAGFLEKNPGDAAITSIATDDAGNVYFFDTTSKVLVRRDPQGRLSKVTTNTERDAFRVQSGKTGSINGGVLRMQTRQVAHATAGAITQVVYAETSPQNYVAGVYAFAPGDFNRDGLADLVDVALFKGVLTKRGVVQTNTANYKFDLNGNAVVDWKDVKVLQSFLDYGDGDVNINGLVDFADFQILQNNFGLATDRTFIQGDLDGDNDVDFSDFQILQNSFGHQSSVIGVNQAPAAFDAAAWNAFAASVPEPGAVGLLGVAAFGLLCRHRRPR